MNKANCKTVLLMIAATFWLATVLDWRGDKFLPFALHTTIFVFAFGLATCAFWPVRRLRLADPVLFWRRATALYITSWQLSVFVTYTLVWDALRSTLARGGLFGLFFIGLLWTIWLLEKFSQKFESDRYVPLNTDALLAAKQQRGAVVRPPKIWHPLDPAAWYYGRANPRLRQSLAGFATYAGVFLLLCIIASRMQGCYEIYEMPAGGGEQKTVAQVVRVQKVIRKKFIVNPFSAIIFETPPIDDVKLQLDEVTEHTYTPGYGEGKGAGFAGGTKRGKVRFIRLEYSGGDWEQDYGIGGDLNMLVKYYELTTHPVANRTESRRVAQLKNFPATKSPPFVYLTGQKNISF
ncbi:MAG: hypothetical protein QF805_28070, partial [Pirellulaceae bacterium]|nr:hypothetical protein [Pirellulaceae bacterium]